MIEEWRWVRRKEALLIHEEQIRRHGGLPGIRDAGLLDSALDRPVNLASYGEVSDPAALAASYGFGIARNHPFIDGNKRTAFVVAAFFLDLCGQSVRTTQEDVVKTVLVLASGDMSEDQFAEWLRSVAVALDET